MKMLIPLTLLLASCANGPSITRTSNGLYHANMGWTLMAKREDVVAEIETKEGDHIKYATKIENSTDVPNMALGVWSTVRGLALTQHSTDLKTSTDGKVNLGAQKADVAKHASDNALKEKTFIPPPP